MDFAQISKDFARIFDKTKLLGVQAHPPPPTPVARAVIVAEFLPRPVKRPLRV